MIFQNQSIFGNLNITGKFLELILVFRGTSCFYSGNGRVASGRGTRLLQWVQYLIIKSSKRCRESKMPKMREIYQILLLQMQNSNCSWNTKC